jgi:hypothetical protein
MSRRSALHAFVLAAAFAAGAALTNRPAAVTAQPAGAPPAAGRGKCIGVAAAQKQMGWVAVYRAFEDGTVEVMNDTEHVAPNKWLPLGK